MAESTALILKVFSGTLSDYLGKRKGLAVFGYALGVFTQPLLAIATSTGIVLAARLLDRLGKGIRGAPRDAMVADIAPSHLRGAAFGLRQSLDTVGAFLGPLPAMALMLLWAHDFRAVFAVAVIPGLLAVGLLSFRVREPARNDGVKRSNPIRHESLKRLGMRYWSVVGVGSVFTLARFSEAFSVLRAQDAGVSVALVPLVLVAMNLTYAASAYPIGKLSDRLSHKTPLALGLVVLIAADATLANADHWSLLLAGVALWGGAHGHHAGFAGHDGCRYGSRRFTRHGLRLLQLDERCCHAVRGQRCRAAVGSVWCPIHVLRRRDLLRDCARRFGMAAGLAEPNLTPR